MESDDDRFASVTHHDRDVAEDVRDGSAFGDYARDPDDDERTLLDAHVIGSTTGLSSMSSRSLPVTEPYERYKSIELRAECYRRGTRPIRSGPKANDNKAGYLMLLRSYDMIQNGGEPNKDFLPLEQQPPHQQQPLVVQTAKKRKVSSPQGIEMQAQSDKSSTTTAASQNSNNNNAVKRRSRIRKNTSNSSAAAQTNSSGPGDLQNGSGQSNGAIGSTGGMSFLHCDQQLATEYMRLKMQILLESRELEKTNRREDKRFKLHAELQGVITTLAQLHRLAKEYTLERDGVLLADVNQDIAYFQDQKRKIKLEMELLDRYR